MTMTETVAPEPTPEQAVLFARVRRMMLIAGLTTALAVGAVLIAIGYRLFRTEGSTVAAHRRHRDPAERRPYRRNRRRRGPVVADAGYSRGDRNPHLRRPYPEAGRQTEIRQRALSGPDWPEERRAASCSGSISRLFPPSHAPFV